MVVCEEDMPKRIPAIQLYRIQLQWESPDFMAKLAHSNHSLGRKTIDLGLWILVNSIKSYYLT